MCPGFTWTLPAPRGLQSQQILRITEKVLPGDLFALSFSSSLTTTPEPTVSHLRQYKAYIANENRLSSMIVIYPNLVDDQLRMAGAASFACTPYIQRPPMIV
jgi:hypothetical protein